MQRPRRSLLMLVRVRNIAELSPGTYSTAGGYLPDPRPARHMSPKCSQRVAALYTLTEYPRVGSRSILSQRPHGGTHEHERSATICGERDRT